MLCQQVTGIPEAFQGTLAITKVINNTKYYWHTMNNILMTKRRSYLADRKEKLLLQKHLYFVCSEYILLMTAFFVCSFSYRDFRLSPRTDTNTRRSEWGKQRNISFCGLVKSRQSLWGWLLVLTVRKLARLFAHLARRSSWFKWCSRQTAVLNRLAFK